MAKTPFVLLGLMTAASFGGPFAIAAAIGGGESPHWPPDRAVEWWTFGLATGLVAALMVACFAFGLAARPKPATRRRREDGALREESRGQREESREQREEGR